MRVFRRFFWPPFICWQWPLQCSSFFLLGNRSKITSRKNLSLVTEFVRLAKSFVTKPSILLPPPSNTTYLLNDPLLDSLPSSAFACSNSPPNSGAPPRGKLFDGTDQERSLELFGFFFKEFLSGWQSAGMLQKRHESWKDKQNGPQSGKKPKSLWNLDPHFYEFGPKCILVILETRKACGLKLMQWLGHNMLQVW